MPLRLCLTSPVVRTWKRIPGHCHRFNSRSTITTEIINDSNVGKWDIFASICLERKPLISKPRSALEKQYVAFLDEYELESSHKSDHELRHLSDARLVAKIKTGEVDSGTIQTAQDFEDKSNSELQTFISMRRRTEADEKNDRKSLDRALDSHLLFLVEQKLGKDYRWSCPQIKVEPNQTLRQGAERILEELCPNIEAKLMGNAPFGFYQYKYPLAGVRNETGDHVKGAKVFFYKANYIKGRMDSSTGSTTLIQVNDYFWLKREELNSKLQEKYHQQISAFLVPEGEEYVTT